MQCTNHSGIEASAICSNCGRPFCEGCIIRTNGKNLCRDCIDQVISNSQYGLDKRFFQQQSQSSSNCAFLTFLDIQKHFLALASIFLFLFGILFIVLYRPNEGSFIIFPLLGAIFLIFAGICGYYYVIKGGMKKW